MKCDHIRTRLQGGTPFFPNMLNNGKVEVCLKEDVDEAIYELKYSRDEWARQCTRLTSENAELKADNEKMKEYEALYKGAVLVFEEEQKEHKATLRALWIMTAEWADAMCLASCNIANKYMSRDRFEVGEDYREKTIKKYRHRQVVFAKYADYCRAKSEKLKEAK